MFSQKPPFSSHNRFFYGFLLLALLSALLAACSDRPDNAARISRSTPFSASEDGAPLVEIAFEIAPFPLDATGPPFRSRSAGAGGYQLDASRPDALPVLIGGVPAESGQSNAGFAGITLVNHFLPGSPASQSLSSLADGKQLLALVSPKNSADFIATFGGLAGFVPDSGIVINRKEKSFTITGPDGQATLAPGQMAAFPARLLTLKPDALAVATKNLWGKTGIAPDAGLKAAFAADLDVFFGKSEKIACYTRFSVQIVNVAKSMPEAAKSQQAAASATSKPVTVGRLTDLGNGSWQLLAQPDDPFLFTFPAALITTGDAPAGSGQTAFKSPQADGKTLAGVIDSRIVAAHRALAAARELFSQAANEADLKLNWWEDAVPLNVTISTDGDTSAPSAFWRHQLRLPLGASENETTERAAREYFQLALSALTHSGDRQNFGFNFRHHAAEPFANLHRAMIAAWFSRQPGLAPGPRTTPARLTMPPLDLPFASWQAEEARLLVDHLATRLAAETGQSPAAALLRRTEKFMNGNELSFAAFTRMITPEPPRRTDKAEDAATAAKEENADLKWQRFFTGFAADLAARASAGLPLPSTPATGDENMRQIRLRAWTSEASSLPAKVYQEAAADDNERRARLAELMVQLDPLAGATDLHRIVLWPEREQATPRPVFFMVDQAGADNSFLVRRSQADGKIDGQIVASAGLTTVASFTSQIHQQDLLIGLVNTADAKPPATRLAYLASPRLLPHPLAANLSQTVRIAGGSIMDRRLLREGMYNGDSFILEIRSSGPLHRAGANPDKLAADDVSLTLSLLDPTGQPVKLESNVSVRCQQLFSSDKPYYVYQLSGRISPDNTASGPCRFSFRLTSPLNLGPGDQEIDDSLTIQLRPRLPRLETLVIENEVNGNRQPLYDSRSGLVRPCPAVDKATLRVKATFSEPMRQDRTTITAGFSPPYASYQATDLACDEKARSCQGAITLPGDDIPAQGTLLRFAIGGENQSGRTLDFDVAATGAQPDTSHSLALGADGYFLLRLTQDTSQVVQAGSDQILAELGPVELSLALFAEPAYDDRPNSYVAHFEDMQEQLQQSAATIEDAIAKLNEQIAAWKKSPAERSSRLLAVKRQQFSELQQDLLASRQNGRLRQFPQQEEATQKRLDELAKAIRQQETDKDFAKGFMAFREEQLRQQQERLRFLRQEVLPLFEGASRLMAGLKKYRYSGEGTSLSRIFFAGARWRSFADTASSPQSADDATGLRMRAMDGKAQGIEADDLTLSGMRPSFLDHGHPGPELLVWDIDRQDFARCRKLLALSGGYPASIVTPLDPGPYAYGENGEEALIAHIDRELAHMRQNIDDVLLTLARKIWEFFPRESRPNFGRLLRPDGGISQNGEALPDVSASRLMLLTNVDRVVGNIPLAGHGSLIAISQQSSGPDEKCQPAGETRQTIDDMFASRETITRSYSAGQYQENGETRCRQQGTVKNQEIGFKTAFDWAGLSAPPELIDASGWDFLPARRRYTALWNTADGLSWRLAASSSPQQFEADPKYSQIIREIYAQADTDTVSGELRGDFIGPAPGRPQVFHYRWRTGWRLDHIPAR